MKLCLRFAAAATSTFLGKHANSVEFSNNTAFPTTLNLFAMPDDNFAYTLAFMAKHFAWTEINVIHLHQDRNGYFHNQRDQFFIYLRDNDLKVQFFEISQLENPANFSSANFSALWKRVVSKRGKHICFQRPMRTPSQFNASPIFLL